MRRNRIDRRRRRKRPIFRPIGVLIVFLVIGIIGIKSVPQIADFSKNIYESFVEKEEPQGSNLSDEYIDIDSDTGVDSGQKKNEISKTKIENIDLLAVGDIMFHMPQVRSAYTGDGSYDFSPTFKYIKEYVSKADIAIANFETVTAGNEKGFSGFPQFNSPKESILALKETGFDILSTANNHCLDRGKDGIISTIDTIEQYGLKSVGTYKNPDKHQLIEEIKGIRLGILSYTYGLNGLNGLLTEEELSYMINLIDEAKIEKDIKDMKDEDVDLIVVCIHWGNEYQREPSPYQIELGHKMVQWGANIVLGSHPHVIQKSEIVEHQGKDNFIIYSMGNFISNQRQETMGNPYTEDGVMLKINIEKNFSTNETSITDITFIPTWVHKYREGNKENYAIVPAEDLIKGKLNLGVSENIISRVKKSYDDSINTLNNK